MVFPAGAHTAKPPNSRQFSRSHFDQLGIKLIPNARHFSMLDNFLGFEGGCYWEISLYKDSPVDISLVRRNK